ncbi:MAG: hypothetical protein H7338_04250 [Candidatus Sericytochromatia bacterium]|nr:hypothetical protein [Candidatus Sericytochromatia bacterium]
MAEAIGLPLRCHVEAGLITIMWDPPGGDSMADLAEKLLARVMVDPHQAKRVGFDGLAGLPMHAISPERFP